MAALVTSAPTADPTAPTDPAAPAQIHTHDRLRLGSPPAARRRRRGAGAVLARIPTAHRPKHRAPTPRTRRRARQAKATAVGTALVVAVSVVAATWTAPPPEQPTVTAAAAVSPQETERVRRAEQVYLAELAAAGIVLRPDEQQAALRIARDHVAHGHLVGMRERIREDWRNAVPRLTSEQVDVARIVVEHHFQAVTGRKQ
jgi:hypothetical protein